MQKSTIVFLLFGFVFLITAFLIEGGNILALLAPTAAMIVFGGTIGAVGVSFPFEEIKHLPKALKIVFKLEKKNLEEYIDTFKKLSAKIRKEGVLSLDKELDSIEDPFLKKGLRLIVDGVEQQTLRNILELDSELTGTRHKTAIEILESAGGYSPTMGVVGTVMGLISVLSNLANPAELGKSIALAFVATLYGVAFANLVYLPLGAKLKAHNHIEQYERQFVMEGLFLLHEAATTMLIEEKLKSFLESKEQMEFDKKKLEKPAA
ncbi:MAG: flagellar motor protein [Candidatus Margulisbacteria bacterium]|nr:flagellar motor protein [Candidatus Margulisiibacteriota bacterium]